MKAIHLLVVANLAMVAISIIRLVMAHRRDRAAARNPIEPKPK